MVDVMTAMIAISGGFMTYLAIPMLAMTAPPEVRKQVGSVYFKLAARSLHQFVILRRVLSGYDIYPISVDNEQKLLKSTLEGSTLGDDDEYPFKDPDNRILRLYNKPVALAYEEVPAAIDAELSELGHWTHEKALTSGLFKPDDEGVGGTVDPYVPMQAGLRLIDPIDAYHLVVNNVQPENVKTAEQWTKKRFEKYNAGLSMEETISGILGFFAGVAGMIILEYVNQQILTGDGGGTSIDIGLTAVPEYLPQAVGVMV